MATLGSTVWFIFMAISSGVWCRMWYRRHTWYTLLDIYASCHCMFLRVFRSLPQTVWQSADDGSRVWVLVRFCDGCVRCQDEGLHFVGLIYSIWIYLTMLRLLHHYVVSHPVIFSIDIVQFELLCSSNIPWSHQYNARVLLEYAYEFL